jgi:hypothetical protein
VNQTFIMLLASWGVLAAVVLGMAVYHNLLARREDDHIHFSEQEAALVNAQTQTAHRIDTLEKWSKMLTILLVSYGVVLALYYLYLLWQTQSTRTLID